MKKISLLLLIIFLLSSCTNNKVIQYRKEGINYYTSKDYEEALNHFNLALKTGEGAVSNVQFDIMQYKAECLFKLGRYDECKKAYEVLLQVDPKNKNYNEFYNIINNITNLNELKKALDNNDLDKANELVSQLISEGFENIQSVLYNRAVLYEKQSDWKEALNSFNYYLRHYPDDESAKHEVDFIMEQLK